MKTDFIFELYLKFALQTLRRFKGDDPVWTADGEKYIRAREFNHYLWLFESQHQLHGLLDIAPILTDREYWPLVGDVWRSADIMLHNKAMWLRLIKSKRGNRELLTTDAEKQHLASLPDKIPIFRGFAEDRAMNGISWTLDGEKAKWFANYAMGPRRQMMGARPGIPRVVSGVCRKCDVIVMFLERGESEIVILPSKVKKKIVTTA